MKIAAILGTRPEAVKLAPVVLELRRRCGAGAAIVLSTGQHRDLVRPALGIFDLEPDIDLGLGRPGQGLADLTARLLPGIDAALATISPDAVIVQGDTTTALVGALAAFYRQLPLGHVEAGLRTGSLSAPFPEEGNRRLVDQIATRLWAPTEQAARNLRNEGFPADRIVVTGNTVVDALERIRPRLGSPARRFPNRPLVLVTLHRRESFGEPLRRICNAIRRLVDERGEGIELLWPVHPNPNVREVVRTAMAGAPNVTLIEPLGYAEFLGTIASSCLVLSDSGGVQEEAPSFGCPVVVLRERTEREEGIGAGGLHLAGTAEEAILGMSRTLLDSTATGPSPSGNPFGDGLASGRIVDDLERCLSAAPGSVSAED